MAWNASSIRTTSAENYSKLSQLSPTFWPISMDDENQNSIAWIPEAHSLFIHYRDVLRVLWARQFPFLDESRTDRANSTNGTFVNQVLGLVAPEAQIQRAFPNRRLGPPMTSSFLPESGRGHGEIYFPQRFSAGSVVAIPGILACEVVRNVRTLLYRGETAQGYCSPKCSNPGAPIRIVKMVEGERSGESQNAYANCEEANNKQGFES